MWMFVGCRCSVSRVVSIVSGVVAFWMMVVVSCTAVCLLVFRCSRVAACVAVMFLCCARLFMMFCLVGFMVGFCSSFCIRVFRVIVACLGQLRCSVSVSVGHSGFASRVVVAVGSL